MLLQCLKQVEPVVNKFRHLQRLSTSICLGTTISNYRTSLFRLQWRILWKEFPRVTIHGLYRHVITSLYQFSWLAFDALCYKRISKSDIHFQLVVRLTDGNRAIWLQDTSREFEAAVTVISEVACRGFGSLVLASAVPAGAVDIAQLTSMAQLRSYYSSTVGAVVMYSHNNSP